MACIFCSIIKKEVPSLSVYENSETLAFLELTPSAPGHLMVISKKHGVSILDYNQEELGEVMVTVQIVAKKIQQALATDSITIGINHLEKRGVKHLHVHLIPRWENDKGGVIQSVVHNKSKETREIIAEKIRKSNG